MDPCMRPHLRIGRKIIQIGINDYWNNFFSFEYIMRIYIYIYPNDIFFLFNYYYSKKLLIPMYKTPFELKKIIKNNLNSVFLFNIFYVYLH